MIGPDEFILLDTGVLLHLFRDDEVGRRVAKDFQVWSRFDQSLISVITVGEILAFARRNNYGTPKRKELDQVISKTIIV